MHMADALLSPVVGVSLCAVSACAVALSVAKLKNDELCEKKIPMMGVMGAFIFAVQMINFTIPVTGSSGHIGGGILLAAVMGGYCALVSMCAVLVIQCLFFADGGLLALGCNIFNIGVIPCLVAYPLFYRPFLKKGGSGRITAASVLAVVMGLQMGAFGVVVETWLSGVAEFPFVGFLLLMQPIHLAIGLAEGIVTAAILCFIYKTRPEITYGSFTANDVSIKSALVMIVLIVLAGGFVSQFASQKPDGLEWAIQKLTESSVK